MWHINESYPTYEGVMSHILIRHVTHISHVTHMRLNPHGCTAARSKMQDTATMPNCCLAHDLFLCVTWLRVNEDLFHSFFLIFGVFLVVHMCDMTHSYVPQDSFRCVTWLRVIEDHFLSFFLIFGVSLVLAPLSLKTFGSPDLPVFPATLLTGTHVKLFLKFLGLPKKRVWYVRGLPWKLVGNSGSRNFLKSDFLRL